MPLPTLASIKKRRTGLGKTQKQLAELSGLSQSVIAKVESSDVDPSYTTAIKIFETLERLEARETTDERLLNLTAKDVMEGTIISVKPNDPVSKAQKLISENDISQLPVINENGKLVGSLTEVQVLSQQSATMLVRDIMLDPFAVVGQNFNISTIRNILLSEPAVVVSDGKSGLAGIITKYDLIDAIRGITG